MRKLILFLATLFVIWTLSIIEADAQTKKGDTAISTINTDSPWFEFIYQGDSKDKTGVRIMVQDRFRQYVAMGYARMKAESKNDDPMNYWVKLIHVPEFGSLAFRQVESLEENMMPEDGIKVLVVRLKDLQEAALIWYQ